ncbi:MAG: hypothetical protein H7326_10965 [Bdellovibrionaceae bacterium]|nr:hypothetical protein [Pseudobdellovibrionaceae bacterium]
MKSNRFFTLNNLGKMLLTLPLSLTAFAEMSMKKVDVKNCNQDGSICMNVTAPSAQIGSLKMIYVMKDVSVEISGPGKRKEILSSPQGYLDFDSNQVVLQKIDKKGVLTEQTFNLTTLERKTFVTK